MTNVTATLAHVVPGRDANGRRSSRVQELLELDGIGPKSEPVVCRLKEAVQPDREPMESGNA